MTPCDIAARMAPSRELENHPDLGLTLARMERMLGVHLQARAHLEIAKRAEQVFTFVTDGFNFESFRDMVFAMFAYYSTLNLESVLKDQGITYFNPKHAKNIVRADILERFLRLLSVDIEEVPAFLAAGASDDCLDRLLSDFTAFREKAFWKFKDDSYLCVDPAFLSRNEFLAAELQSMKDGWLSGLKSGVYS